LLVAFVQIATLALEELYVNDAVFPDTNTVFSAPVINLLSFGAIGIFASNAFLVLYK